MEGVDLAERRLVVAANRGPVSFHDDPSGEPVVTRGPGGLVTVLTEVLRHHPGTWVAAALSDAERRLAAEECAVDVALDGEEYRVRYVAPVPGRLPQVLQRRHQPDAVVHPALPLGPRPAPGHPRRGDGRLAQRLPGRERPVREGRGGRGAPGAGRAPAPRPGGRRERRAGAAARLPALLRRPGRPGRLPRRVPAPVRPHPVAAERLLARAAGAHPRGRVPRAAGQRRGRLPHAPLRAQLPALLRRPPGPRGGRGARASSATRTARCGCAPIP